jgi:sugar lactone lactonase YvrE
MRDVHRSCASLLRHWSVPLVALLAACSSDSTAPRAATRLLYVADATSNEIWVFPANAEKDVDAMPVRTIAGPHTGLNVPEGLALDAAGRLYVSNHNGNAITVYAPGASGDAPPVASIVGPSTRLQGPLGLAFDAAGRLYVANAPGPGSGIIAVYAAGASGDAAPIAQIGGPSTGLDFPWGVAVDAAGRIIASSGGDSILVYAPGALGDAAPSAVIAGPSTRLASPLGIVLDATSRQHGGEHLYVANLRGDRITVHAVAASGDAAPLVTIEGQGTELFEPDAVALDATGRLYVANAGNTAVAIFAAGASGNAGAAVTLFLFRAGVNDIEAIALGP